MLVCLVRTLSDGTVTREWLSPLEAVAQAQTGPQNGKTVASCHIEGDVSKWDMSYVPTPKGGTSNASKQYNS